MKLAFSFALHWRVIYEQWLAGIHLCLTWQATWESMVMMMTCYISGYDYGGDNDDDLVDDGNIEDDFFL